MAVSTTQLIRERTTEGSVSPGEEALATCSCFKATSLEELHILRRSWHSVSSKGGKTPSRHLPLE